MAAKTRPPTEAAPKAHNDPAGRKWPKMNGKLKLSVECLTKVARKILQRTIMLSLAGGVNFRPCRAFKCLDTDLRATT